MLHKTSDKRKVIYWLFPRKYSDFASLGQKLDNVGFIVCVVDTGLPELSWVAVLLPVVVPVSTAVCSKTKHIYLEENRRECGKVQHVSDYKCVSEQDQCDVSVVSAWYMDIQYEVMWK